MIIKCFKVARSVRRVVTGFIPIRPVIRTVRRIAAPSIVCVTMGPPSLEPPARHAPPMLPPAIMTPPTPFTYVLPPGPILPPGVAAIFLPPTSGVDGYTSREVPEPASFWLLVSAVGALVIFRRPM